MNIVDNYICINGCKMALTNDQLEKLGLLPKGRTLAEIVEMTALFVMVPFVLAKQYPCP